MKFHSLIPWGIDSNRDLLGNLQKDFFSPRLDVSENDKQITVTAELPGLEEKDIELEVTNNVLSIKGKKEIKRDESKDDYHIVERSSGAFSRSLSLQFDVDPAGVKASFKDGVLTVDIPKPQPTPQQSNKIQITKA